MITASWSGHSRRHARRRASCQARPPTPTTWSASTRRTGSPPWTCSAGCSPTTRAGPRPRRCPSSARSARPSTGTGAAPVPGADEAIEQLRESGVRVCLITSLSRRLLGLVLDTLGWWRLVDLRSVPRGRAARLPVARPDAHRDAAAGRRGCPRVRLRRKHRQRHPVRPAAGARIVAGVLTGGHTRDRLRAAGATHCITDISEFPGCCRRGRTAEGSTRGCVAGGRRAPGQAVLRRRAGPHRGPACRPQPSASAGRSGPAAGYPWSAAARGYSSAGRAPALQAGGRGFESPSSTRPET